MSRSLTIRILRGEESIRPELPALRRLAIASGSTFIFNRPEVPLLWWKHFHGKDGADFGTKRGRNFLGVRTRLEEVVFVVAEDAGIACGMAALVESEVALKSNAPPLKLLSFCGDSVILFYQDLVALPEGRDATVTALADALADLADKEGRTLFLGHIPDDSPNLPALKAAVDARLARGWQGGLADNRFRGGVYPWTTHKLADALGSIKEALPEGDASLAALRARAEGLAGRLETQGPALVQFAGTRIAFEKEVKEVVAEVAIVAERAAAASENTAQAVPAASGSPKAPAASLASDIARITACLEGDVIQYPYLALPAVPDAYLDSLSSSRRYYFRRYLKKYNEAGADFQKVAAADVTDADIEEYLQLHLERWGTDSVAVNPSTLTFHRELCREAADQGLLTLFFARHGGKRLVAHVCLDIGGRREYFFSGRTSGSEELRAGKLMVMHTILDAITSGFAVYDFGYGGDEYKADFTKVYRIARSAFLVHGPERPDLDRIFPKYECIRFSGE
jgi:GNAT acetyltransferase-like protein